MDPGGDILPVHRGLAAAPAGAERGHAAAGEVHHGLLRGHVHPGGPRLLLGDSRDQVQGGPGLPHAGHGLSGHALRERQLLNGLER